jgi:hypothetical protein
VKEGLPLLFLLVIPEGDLLLPLPLLLSLSPKQSNQPNFVILSEVTDSVIVSGQVEGPAFAFGLPLLPVNFPTIAMSLS